MDLKDLTEEQIQKMSDEELEQLSQGSEPDEDIEDENPDELSPLQKPEPSGEEDKPPEGKGEEDKPQKPETEKPEQGEQEQGQPAPELTEDLKRLEKLGLNNRFSTIDQALENFKHQEVYIGNMKQLLAESNKRAEAFQKQFEYLQQQQDELKKAGQQQQDIDPQEFIDNPIETLKKYGFTTKEDIDKENEKLRQQIDSLQAEKHANYVFSVLDSVPELKNVASSFKIGQEPPPGYNPYYDKMTELFQQHPSLAEADFGTIVEFLFPRAKAIVDAGIKPPVPPVSKDVKNLATTTGGGTKPGSNFKTNNDLSKMSDRELQEYAAALDKAKGL